MKSLYKSAIAIAVFGALFVNTVNAGDVYIQDVSGLGTQGVFIHLQGQDESVKSYDLDQIDANTAAINVNTNTINTVQGVTTDNADKISALRGDLTAEANERISNNAAQDKIINANTTAIDGVNADLQTSKQALSDKAQVAQDTANNALTAADSVGKKLTTVSNAIQGEITQEADTRLVADRQLNDRINTEKQARIDSDKLISATNDNQDVVLDNHETRIQKLESQPVPKDGVDGKDGAKGDKGDTGATGAKGDKGETGAQGLAGINGRDGVNGHNGKDGVTTTVTQKQVDTATQAKVAKNSLAVNAATQELQATRQTLQAMNNATSQQFKSLLEEVDNNKKQANAGISGAMAMAGLPQVQTNQRMMFSAGGATYNGESALAVGASVNFSSHVIAKVSFSDDTANNMGASVGIGLGF
ncbi:YadA-like family protein [Enterobacter cloacae complex sp. P40RS]|uniref:YadA-like family protein n=1 Tax=Enterobacter pasteurii TaxID=3029761 RepID=A0ABR9QD66_9ENTR|nr:MULTISPECIES: YadA-like family protein [Enterobacter cloacae complex]MBE4856757.1 YadA-like family protein [Enterobacter pasteurii]MBE4863292.1 YadA-like family protein [Enterobacter cloacae complex sp. P40C2]MBE4876660.1 YadA-like family protein [Enterobacter cloacae complex sp. P40C]